MRSSVFVAHIAFVGIEGILVELNLNNEIDMPEPKDPSCECAPESERAVESGELPYEVIMALAHQRHAENEVEILRAAKHQCCHK